MQETNGKRVDSNFDHRIRYQDYLKYQHQVRPDTTELFNCVREKKQLKRTKGLGRGDTKKEEIFCDGLCLVNFKFWMLVRLKKVLG